jgi:hypothetical protein
VYNLEESISNSLLGSTVGTGAFSSLRGYVT